MNFIPFTPLGMTVITCHSESLGIKEPYFAIMIKMILRMKLRNGPRHGMGLPGLFV